MFFILCSVMNCGICFERFRATEGGTPRIFPCGHCYCSKCIGLLLKYCPSKRRCPDCRKSIGSTRVDAFPKNESLIEIIITKRPNSKKTKLACPSEARAPSLVGHWKTFYDKAALFCNKSQLFVDSFFCKDEGQGHCTSAAALELEMLKRLSLELNALQPTLGMQPHETPVPKRRHPRQSVQHSKQRWRY